jgi:hypothetical protein
MKLTVVRDDGAVYKDNISYDCLDMRGVPTNVHSLQWKETYGWIEFSEQADGTKQANTPITVLPEWATDLISLWDAAKTPPVPAPTYQELRAAAYPPFSDYLDGIVKGSVEQVQAYVDACLAVKARFPKPANGDIA